MKLSTIRILLPLTLAIILGLVVCSVHSERPDHQCGPRVGNPPCGNGRCCSVSGWCGGSASYCRGQSCDYQCWSIPDLGSDGNFLGNNNNNNNNNNNPISEVISENLFDEMFKHTKFCPSKGFYSYEAFVTAASSFPGFGTAGDVATRKREIAAFLGHISQLTTGEIMLDSVDSHSWGLCHINTTTEGNEVNNVYCTSLDWPCSSGKKYSSRGPIQLTHNYNYGLAGEALGLDLINDPDLVAEDAIVSFKTAIWFWMTQHDHNKPSCHYIFINDSNKVPSFEIGHIIKSGTSIGIEYYKRYCDMLGVSYGDHYNLKYWYI